MSRVILGVFGVVVLAAVSLITYVIAGPIPEGSYYVGSDVCKECHTYEHKHWKDSTHPKMMRKAVGDVIVADFSHENPDVQFEQSEAVWAIGGKWEQQFMGHDGETETLLPGAWMVEPEKWNVKNWDGWKTPEPLKRCHGCHTVGLDVSTGEFKEPGVGCESCHGPSSWHANTNGYGKVSSLLDAQVCGQCHSRGKSPDDQYFFPIGYKPGKNLEAFFTHLKPDDLQNSSAWWGNGRERKRHQEYFAWQQGGHAQSLVSLTQDYDGRYGEVVDSCLPCHSAEAALAAPGVKIAMEQ